MYHVAGRAADLVTMSPGSSAAPPTAEPSQVVAFDALGVTFEVNAPTTVLQRLRARLGRAARVTTPGQEGRLAYRFVDDGRDDPTFVRSDGIAVSGHDWEAAVDLLSDHLHTVVANRSGAGVFVHAGAFAWEDRLVVVPGRSHSGKSSLVAAAVRRGATYFSDEFCVVDRDGFVVPYPRPIVLRTSEGRQFVDPEADLGGAVAVARLRTFVILVTQFEPGCDWRPSVVSGARAALPIVANSVHARPRAEPTLRAASRLASSAAAVLVGPRGDADSMLGQLEERVRSLAVTLRVEGEDGSTP